MKKIVNNIVCLTLSMCMFLSFGWFTDIFENAVTTRSTRTIFMADGTAKDYVTIYNSNDEIIDEYIVIRGNES